MMRLELDESRRLTGPNLLWDHPGAILDVWVDGIDKEDVVLCWQQQVARILAALDWQEQTTYRTYKGGLSLALSAPMDVLYSACEIAEFAWTLAVEILTDAPQSDFDENLMRIRDAWEQERNPALISMMQDAKKHAVTCISDDDYCSLGMGKTVSVFNIRELPDSSTIAWQDFQDIPLALITGTNGKSTSVRLASEIAKAASLQAGVTSTDFIRVGDDILDTGDYSGPGGARILIRDKRTEIAFLEVARGGILRRGLPVERVDAGLITNIAEDHLGQYGIDTVEELAEVKFVIAKAIDERGILSLNADNELVAKLGQKLTKPICWYSEDKNHPLVAAQRDNGKPACYVSDNQFVYFNGVTEIPLCPLNEAPITFNGSAQHNIQNVLGVIGLCFGLGLSKEAIVSGLSSFGQKPEDNPGRGNLYQHDDTNIIVDFAHNEHSMRAVVAMAKQMPASQRIVMFSHAGDRSDAEMKKLTDAVAELDADLYIAAEVSRYLRGREPMVVPQLSRDFLLDAGIDRANITIASSPTEGAKLALQKKQPGAVILLFTLDEREQVQALLK